MWTLRSGVSVDTLVVLDGVLVVWGYIMYNMTFILNLNEDLD